MASEEDRLEQMLTRWGPWCLRGRQAPALGYSTRTVEARLRDEGGVLISGQGSMGIIEVDEDSEMIEALMGILRGQRPLFAEILEQKYVWGCERKQIAEKVSISEAMVKVYLGRAMAWVGGAVTIFEHRRKK